MKTNKNNIFVGMLLMTLAIGAVVNINLSNNRGALLVKLAIDNVDALADSEGGGVNIPCSSVCYDKVDWTCRIMYNGKFHKDCERMKAY